MGSEKNSAVELTDVSRTEHGNRVSDPTRSSIMLHPISSRILVKRDREETSAGGIHLPEASQEHTLTGTVIAAGPLCELVAAGDRVMWARFSGHEVAGDISLKEAPEWDGVSIMNEEDLVAIIQEVK